VKLVVGLGNPGSEYADTRHNVGFRVVERLAERHAIALRAERRLEGRVGEGTIRGVRAALLLPLTYMNRSGRAVAAALEERPLDEVGADLLVVYDDLDLPFGRLRIRPGGGAGGHRGLADVQAQLGRSDFPRLRFGIGRPAEGLDGVDHVLAPFDPAEAEALAPRLALAVEAVEAVLYEGVAAAMNRFNRDPETPPPSSAS
jgi:PTH1 family peptidyl-tRNA hydrolase